MKFKNYIETESGIKDTSTSPGTAGQLLSSTVAGTSWIDQGTIHSGSSEVIDIQVKNISSANGGVNLSKGDPVYIYGSVGASARLYIDLADADSTATNNLGDSKMPCVGLLDQDLSPNGEGTATVVGKLRNLITSPINGVTPNENDTLYVKSGGGLTLTKPTGSTNLIQNVGQIGRVSTSADGNIVVAALLRSNDVPNLPQGRIWVGDGNTIVSDTVYLDETNNRMGIGTTSPKQLLHLQKGGLSVPWTAPDSEVIRVQSKGSSEITGNPPASDVNIFTARNGYARVIFTDDLLPYGENGVVMDFVSDPPTLNLVTKANKTLICDYNASVYCGANHTLTSNSFAFAAGDGNNPSGIRSFAAGHLTEATGDISAAFGYDTLASGGASFSIGALTTASGGNSFASGGGSTASGGESAAFGFETTASGEESFAIGNNTTASGPSSFAGGGPTTLASGSNAFAFGADVDITGSHSAGFGRLHDVAGNENLVGGLSNVVNGAANLVAGANNNLLSSSNNLVAGGSHTFGSSAGDYNTVIGFSNECNNGAYSLIGGQDAFNFGSRSISFGSGTTASLGNQQFAFGEGTTTPVFTGYGAIASNQFVVGKFNNINVGCLFAVGNGTSDSARSTALHVSTGGQVGIGTVQPQYALHVAGGNDAAVKVERTISGSEGQLTMLAGLGENLIQSKGLGNAVKKLNFSIGVSPAMTIDTNGYVGIGDTSPSEKLEVNGHVKAVDGYKGYVSHFHSGGFDHFPRSQDGANPMWIPSNYIVDASSDQYYNIWIPLYAGRIRKIILKNTSGTPTASVCTFRKKINGVLSGTTYAGTVTGGGAAGMKVTFDFGTTNFTFNAEDEIQIGIVTGVATQPPMRGVSYQIWYEYNIT